jgi:hypothetical protein
MKVFISWSGVKSQKVAEELRDWLPQVIQEIEPFMSQKDIAAGQRWTNEIAQELEGTQLGIVCVTRENQSARWLNFEAGAIAKEIDESRMIPLAIDLKDTDVKPPLGLFQAKALTESGILELLESLNQLATRPVPDLRAAFEKWWPDLDAALSAVSSAEEEAPVRTERDLLEEILFTVRGLQARPGPPWPPAIGQPAPGTRPFQQLATRIAYGFLVVNELKKFLPRDAEVVPRADIEGLYIIKTTEELSSDVVAQVWQVARGFSANVEFVVGD